MKLGPTGGYLTIACPDGVSLAYHGGGAAAEDHPTALSDALSLGVCVCWLCRQCHGDPQPPGLPAGCPA